MPSFICKVITPQGQVIKIKLNEEDKITCLKKLKRNGMTPIEVKPSLIVPKKVSTKISSSIASKKIDEKIINLSKDVVKSISLNDIKEFTKEFLFLREAKFSNEHALKTIIANTKNQNFKKILVDILKNSEKDIFIYKTLESYRQIFPLIYINLIKNGELTGVLDKGLKNAIAYLENEEKIDDILQEKVFPSILVIFATVLMMFLSVVIGIPLIQDMLLNINVKLELPLITKVILTICNIVVYKWYILAILLVLIIIGCIIKLKTSEGKLKLDEFKYKNNIFGKALYLLDFTRITRCLLVNHENKMRIQDSLEVCKNVIKNTYMLNTIEKSINSVFKGKLWTEAFEKDKILNPIIIEMLKKDSESKNSEFMCKTIKYLEQQLEKELKKVVVKITEIFYISFGILFLLYTVTVLLPCISIYLSNFLLF